MNEPILGFEAWELIFEANLLFQNLQTHNPKEQDWPPLQPIFATAWAATHSHGEISVPQDVNVGNNCQRQSNHPSVLDLWCLLFKLLRGLRFHEVYLDIRTSNKKPPKNVKLGGISIQKTIGMKLSRCHLINKRSLDFSKNRWTLQTQTFQTVQSFLMSIPSCHISIHQRAPWIPRLLALKAWLQGLWGEFVAPAKQQVEVPRSWRRRVTVPNAQQTTGWIEVVGWTGMWTRKWSPNAYSQPMFTFTCAV